MSKEGSCTVQSTSAARRCGLDVDISVSLLRTLPCRFDPFEPYCYAGSTLPVAVGTGIAPRPPHGPGRARLTHPVLIAGKMRTDRGSHEHPL